MWSDILKRRTFGPNDDTTDAEYGDIIIKPDGSKFVLGQGFTSKPYQKDKAPIKRDKDGNILEPFETDEEGEYTQKPQTRVGTKQELVNWFNTIIQESYERFLEKLGTKFVTANEQDEMMLNRDETASSKGMKRVGMEIAQQNIESMVEGYLTSISGDTGVGEPPPKSFIDSSTNIQGIMGSSAYGKILDAALKFTEQQLSGIFDVQLRVQQRNFDAPDDYEDESEEDFTGEPSKEWGDSNWSVSGGSVINLTENLIKNVDNMLEDIIGDGDTSIADLDGDGNPDINNESIGKEIKTSLLNLYQEPIMNKLLKQFTNYVGFNFILKIVRGQLDMEANEEAADQVTEEQAEEMRNRPEIEFGEEDEEERRRFEQEFKSNDRYTGELDWFSILSKGAGKGLTSNAGFRPAIANVSYKPPCKNCKDKKSPCGCGK